MIKLKEKLFSIITQMIGKIRSFIEIIPNDWVCSVIDSISHVRLSSPYLRLMRVDRPVPYVLLMAPIWWLLIVEYRGNFFETCIYLAILTLGGVIMRSVGCIINDIIDQKFDSKVERTKKRVLPNGDLTLRPVAITISILLAIAFVLMLTLPIDAIKFCLFIPTMVIIYPFSKRFIAVPQLVLGLTYNLGIWVAWLTVQRDYNFYVPGLLYVAAVLWTFGYDTMYAYQDIADDRKLGLNSSSIYFGKKLPESVWSLYRASCVCIGLVGFMQQLSIMFFIILGVATYTLYLQTERFDFAKPELAAKMFSQNIVFGLLVTFGFYIG